MWPRIRAFAVTASTLLAVALVSAAPAPADRELFVRYGCYQCHGYEGQGGEALRIAPSPYPFDAFAAKVRKPANEMPAYAPEVLSDADLQALYRYVRAIPEPPADLPLR
jgi:mono/diheme cytochrome c family protein